MIYGSLCSGMVKVGDKFGRLTVTEVYQPRRVDQSRVKTVCECGAEVDTTASAMRHGSKLSCGCLRRDRVGAMYRTHGQSKTPRYTMFYDARKRAIAFGLPFSIEPDDIDVPDQCPILGIPLNGSDRNHTPSLDRIIPDEGYVVGNVMVISFRANRLKSDASAAELRAILAYLDEANK